MVYIIAAGLSIAFALAGMLHPQKPLLLFVLAGIAFIAAVASYYQADKKSQKDKKDIKEGIEGIKEETCDTVRLLLEEHLVSVEEQPELTRLKEIAKKTGLPLDACLLKFEQSTLFDQGLKALLDRRYDDAVQLFTKNAQTSKQEPVVETWFFLGNALSYQGNYTQAAESYQEAVKHKPDHAHAWNNWGAALGELGKYEEAIEKYQDALKHKPDHAEAWTNWGIALGKLNKHEEAIEKYQEALKYKPDDAKVWNNWGAALGKLGKHEEAIEKFEKALKHKPDLLPAKNNLKKLLMAQQQAND